jgi:hypothetical protein
MYKTSFNPLFLLLFQDYFKMELRSLFGMIFIKKILKGFILHTRSRKYILGII